MNKSIAKYVFWENCPLYLNTRLVYDDVLFSVLFNLALEKVVRDIPEIMEILGLRTLLVYTNDIILFKEFGFNVEENVKNLITSSYVFISSKRKQDKIYDDD